MTIRHIQLEGASNFRDLGGYENRKGERVRWGRVFRSDNLSELVPADWARLSELEIGLVADLRNDAERAFWPGRWGARWPVEFLMRDYEMDLRELSEVGYHILAYQQVELLRRFFRILAQPEAPAVLVHCTAGQDRTGFACAFLLTLLDVPFETILKDYSLSHELRRHVLVDPARAAEMISFYGLDGTVEELIERQSISVEERRAQAEGRLIEALDHIAGRHGSIAGFIHDELQVDDAMTDAIRAALLVEEGPQANSL